MSTAESASSLKVQSVLERLRTDAAYYAANCAQIVNKQGKRIPFAFNKGQHALDYMLEEQRLAGKAQRAIVLKARQIGFSTYAQLKLIQRTTLRANHSAIVVAHDLETGAKLYRIGRRIYSHLPDEGPLKPPIGSHKRARLLHFANPEIGAWQSGAIGLDSEYLVNTAGEVEAGRGGTYHSMHGSEVAFWPDIEAKLTGLMQAIPSDPDSLVILESTAFGHNHFKDLWDLAVTGDSEFLPFFWPWWKHDEYRLEMTEAERCEFRIGDTTQSAYAEGEELLAYPGPVDTMDGEHYPLELEQLKWRRWTIANKLGGKIDKWNQEYPTAPEDAFLSTGAYVFEPIHVRSALIAAERITPTGIGILEPGKHEERLGRFAKVEVPLDPTYKAARDLLPGASPDWKLWIDLLGGKPPKEGLYVVGVDVSGGVSEAEEGEPAFHAIEVIDHRTKRQVAEYSSRCDPDLLAEHIFLTANFFNEAWLAIEITGGWGLPMAREIWLDWRYRFMYRRKTHDRSEDHESDRLGWNTDRATKPILLALGQEFIRGENHGIQSPELCREMLTYIQQPTGKTEPERGKFADRLMAWLIAQQVAQELPLRERKPKKQDAGFRPRNPVTGY